MTLALMPSLANGQSFRTRAVLSGFSIACLAFKKQFFVSGFHKMWSFLLLWYVKNKEVIEFTHSQG